VNTPVVRRMCKKLGLWRGLILLWLSLSVIYYYSPMASSQACKAPGCSWEKATDSRGLSRHRATCQSYNKYKVLSSQKRHERAKEAARSPLTRNGLVRRTVAAGTTEGLACGSPNSSVRGLIYLSCGSHDDLVIDVIFIEQDGIAYSACARGSP
jgi:hypothetical protein